MKTCAEVSALFYLILNIQAVSPEHIAQGQ